MPIEAETSALSRDEIMERLVRIVARVKHDVDKDAIKPEASFAEDLGIDSLETVEIALALERDFEVKFDEAHVKQAVTVEDAVSCIRDRLTDRDPSSEVKQTSPR